MMDNDFKKRVDDFERRKELPGAPAPKSLPPHERKRRRHAAAKAAAAAAGTAAAAAPLITPPPSAAHAPVADTPKPASTSDAEEVSAMSGIMKGSFWALVFLLGVALCGLLYYAGRTSTHTTQNPTYASAPVYEAHPYYVQRAGLSPDAAPGVNFLPMPQLIPAYAEMPQAQLPGWPPQPEMYATATVYPGPSHIAPIPASPAQRIVINEPIPVRMLQPVQVEARANSGQQARQPMVVYYFGTDETQVPENASLNDLARLAEATGRDIVIKAYADPSGPAAYNRQLSQRRADAVRSYLVRHGVNPDDISAKGYGATDAFGSNASDRRAEVILR